MVYLWNRSLSGALILGTWLNSKAPWMVTGLLTVEIDFAHPEVAGQEDAAVEKSVKYLQKLVKEL
jgi:hypothetical protein